MVTSSRHKQLQKGLFLNIHCTSLKLEKRFASIHRIADLAWEEKKIVFEIQCSFIEKTEVVRRVKDYASIGYSVIWLLDDNCFGKRYQNHAEALMQDLGAKYITLSKHSVLVYDQVENHVGRLKIKKHSFSTVEIQNPYLRIKAPTTPKQIPKELYSRWHQTDYIFPGDLLDQMVNNTLLRLPSRKKDYIRTTKRFFLRMRRYSSFFFHYFLTHLHQNEEKEKNSNIF
ncbi:hypothetical protein COB21_03345 [Candidatus Aerophobetes bacterium]|uniref:Competence protein CoiA nuclease-like domain-containing protein n=1 Tax=Aerophobetes bacterium TaxID=2030807 RepID=A0A2A4X3D5_UNCAE|nr:MAG: hypothetical protein COB21_03345 [Candidatus Aerophobetes bacterium]